MTEDDRSPEFGFVRADFFFGRAASGQEVCFRGNGKGNIYTGKVIYIRNNKMKIRLNEDKEIVKQVAEGLIAKGGYCPCRVGKLPENKCMCEEFRRQIADENFEGYCHCRLFYKQK